jgi:hypothetical protein
VSGAVQIIETQRMEFPSATAVEKRMGQALLAAAIGTKERAMRRFAGMGIGRRFFMGLTRGRMQGPGDVRKLKSFFKVDRLVDLQRAFVTDVIAKNLAGIQEVGGRTKAHEIDAVAVKARRAITEGGGRQGFLKYTKRGSKGRIVRLEEQPRLAFVGRGGRIMQPRRVRHPGGLLRKKPAIEPEIPQALAELDRNVLALLDRSFS